MDSCRGDDNKKLFTQRYFLTPIIHIELQKGNEKKCCCNDALKNRSECYIFYAVNKVNQKEIFSFYAGASDEKSCAIKLLELIGHEPFPKFNPLIDDIPIIPPTGTFANKKNLNQAVTPHSISNRKPDWDPLNKELYKAICMLIMSWDINPYGILMNILSFLIKHPETRTQEWSVKKVNDIIGKDKRKRKINQMISDLAANGQTTKHIYFPEIIEVIKKLKENDPLIINNFID